MECLPAEMHAHVFPVGRLDKDTTGLLLLTDDGDLAYRCLHPSHHVPKTYRVTVARAPSEKSLRQLRQGVELDDGVTAPAEVWLKRTVAEGAQVEITIREGRNRQVRRMFGTIGHPVLALERISMGPLLLGKLPPGEWRELREEEVQALREAGGV